MLKIVRSKGRSRKQMAANPDSSGFHRRFPGMNPENGKPGNGNATERNRRAIGRAHSSGKHRAARRMVGLILVAARLAFSTAASHTSRRGAEGMSGERS